MLDLVRNPILIVVVSLAILAGCAQEQSPGAAAAQERSRALTPSDAAIAKIYNRSCRGCHSIAATGAPLTGDARVWPMLMEKGMDVLVNNVVTGIGGMPPYGMCMACDVSEFEALIAFMAKVDDSSGNISD